MDPPCRQGQRGATGVRLVFWDVKASESPIFSRVSIVVSRVFQVFSRVSKWFELPLAEDVAMKCLSV